jgi:hypothetical protein
LGRFVTPAEHDNQGVTFLRKVHAPARAKELTHFAHPFANGLNVTQQSALDLVKPLGQPDTGQTIL